VVVCGGGDEVSNRVDKGLKSCAWLMCEHACALPSAMARVKSPWVIALGLMPSALSSFMSRTASLRWQLVSPPRMQATRRALEVMWGLWGFVGVYGGWLERK
jgi:hypothetical protein